MKPLEVSGPSRLVESGRWRGDGEVLEGRTGLEGLGRTGGGSGEELFKLVVLLGDEVGLLAELLGCRG